MSTGDSRRSAPKKSTTPAAAGGTDAEATDAPVGGVLPVKKAVRPASGKAGSGGAAGRTGGNGSGRTGGNGSGRTGGNGNGAAKTTDAADTTTDAGAKATPAPAKSATAAAPAKATPARAAAAKAAGKSTTGGRSTVTETIESTSVFARKSAAKAPGSRTPAQLGGGKGGGRRPVTPVKVAERRNWGPIFLYVTTGILALAIIGFGAWPVLRDSMKGTWQEQAAGIPGILNYGDPASPTYNEASTLANHVAGDLTYEVSPPVGGNHNSYWQNCMGDIYPAQIADEHAVHALEHGAVWITYNPDLPQDQIDKLADRVRDVPYMLMSPYPGLDPKVSLQSWDYQLKVSDAGDGRIDDFINALRENNSQEPGAPCSGGVTDTGTTPLDLGGGV